MFELISALGFESWEYLAAVSIFAVAYSTMCVFSGYTRRSERRGA